MATSSQLHASQPACSTALQLLTATIAVIVRPCLPGEYAMFSNASAADGPPASSNGGQTLSVTCSACAAPMYSFTADTAPGSTTSSTVCQSCPARGICVAGELWPVAVVVPLTPRLRCHMFIEWTAVVHTLKIHAQHHHLRVARLHTCASVWSPFKDSALLVKRQWLPGIGRVTCNLSSTSAPLGQQHLPATSLCLGLQAC